jgi:hypothetical protein
MRKLAGMMMAAAALLALAATVEAADAKHDTTLLEDERQEHAWAAQNAKGVDKAAHHAEEQRVQELIDSLQRGERVDTSEVDRVLNRTY